MTAEDPCAKSDSLVPLKRSSGESLDQFLYRHVFEAILAQRLLPGTKLTEDELAEIFDVSRAVVRRALLRLSHDRIVDIRPNRGATVARPSVSQAREILSARRLIEGAIVKEAVLHASDTQLAELRALVADEQACFERDERGSGIRLSGDFHLKLALASGNSTLIKFVKELIPQTSLIIAQYEKPGFATCSHLQHFEIIDVIASADVERAVGLMDEHLLGVENKLDLVEDEARSNLRQVFADLPKPQSR